MQDTISRKDFIKNAFRLFKNEVNINNAKPVHKGDAYLYPPGIESVENFLEKCQQSYKCISVCPHEALQVYREDENDKRYSFPQIKPRQCACYYCDDFPCIAACESGALTQEYKTRKLGLAVINTNLCFAYNDTFCQACIMNCPLTGKAIYADMNNQPVIIEEHCIGCGLCVQCCPAEKEAIVIQANLK